MALIITIIVLIILAGITIGTLTGENGIVKNSQEAKIQTEIANEKEIIDKSSVEAMGKNKRGNLVEEEFQEAMDSNTGEDKTEVTDIGDEFEVYFKESNRYYNVDKNGSILGQLEVVTDPYPGDITKDEKGNTLTGNSEKDAYQINCIEDLVALSNLSRGIGVILENGEIKELTQKDKTSFSGKYIIMTKNLNFKSRTSYIDSERKEFGDINGDSSDGNSLITEMTTGNGFLPMSLFAGTLNGNGKILSNLYEKKEGNAGLAETMQGGTVKNLEITGDIICLGDNAGGISAYHGTFENCINRVNIKATGNQIGGICGGEYSGTITNCKNYGTIEGATTVGGVSATWGTIINCQNYGIIKGTSNIGGISGIYAVVENCQNYGEIGEETSINAGGIIGQTTDSLVNNCINYGEVRGKEAIGGIGGNLLNARMISCINFGEINATNQRVGGIAGYGNFFYNVINCCNLGNVKGNNIAGGIIGELEYINAKYDVKIINCYNVGKIESKEYKGGIIGVKRGYGTHYIENCYWKEELNLECGENIMQADDGVLEITNSREYKEEEMKSDTFLQILNNYVQTYNAGDKTYSKGKELLMWKFDGKTLYPVF